MPVYVLAGEEEFEISRRVQSLKNQLLDPDWVSFNFSRIEGGDLRSVIEAAGSVPFGPGNKVILFDRCDLFTKKRVKGEDAEQADRGKSARDKSLNLLDELDAALPAVAASTYLIFACQSNFDSSLKVSKVFARHEAVVKIVNFEKKKYFAGSENGPLVTWCQKEAHAHGAVIDDEAVFYLAESTEVNLRQMSREIEKAATYILPHKRITLSHVSELSPHFSHVFALLDHFAAGRKAQVLESVQEILSRQSALPVIAVMQTTLSKWVVYKTKADELMGGTPGGRDVRRREISPRDLAARLSPELKVNQFVLQMDLQRIRNLSLPYLVEKKKELTDLEYKVKTGQLPEAHALSIFFTR